VEVENRQILAECLSTLGEEAMSENDEDQEMMDYEEFEPREDEYEDDDNNNNNNKPPSPAPTISRISLNSLLN
jgi:hypothetical protein